MTKHTVLFNPFTGAPRQPFDIASDPEGLLIWDREEKLEPFEEPTRLDVELGKYTLLQRCDGRLEALRRGAPWRDMTGDKMVGALFSELRAARDELIKQRPALTAVFDREVWEAIDHDQRSRGLKK